MKEKKWLYLLPLMVLSLIMMNFQSAEFFSSMTKVDYVEGNKTLKFTTKMNAKHIANTIKVEPNKPNFDAELKKYVTKCFNVSINGNPKNLNFTGTQINGDAVWVYFEANDISNINDFKIKNTILLENYPKQFNVVNIAYKGQQKTMNFTRGKEISTVNF